MRGEIDSVDTKLLNMLTSDEYIPVIAPIGCGEHGESYNINADTVASAVATALKAEKLMFLTDIDGIRRDPEDPSTLIYEISSMDVAGMIADGIVSGRNASQGKGMRQGYPGGGKPSAHHQRHHSPFHHFGNLHRFRYRHHVHQIRKEQDYANQGYHRSG